MAWLSAGEADTEGGDAGFSDSMLARALGQVLALPNGLWGLWVRELTQMHSLMPEWVGFRSATRLPSPQHHELVNHLGPALCYARCCCGS